MPIHGCSLSTIATIASSTSQIQTSLVYYCLYYWIIAPLRGGIVDTPERGPAFTVQVQPPDQKVYDLSLYCDKQGNPEFARCRLSNLENESLPETVLPLLQSLKEHLLSVLRLTYRPDVMFAEPGTVWTFINDGDPANFSLLIDEFGSRSYDPEPTRNLFIQSFEVRELVRLYVDGVDARLPLQYQFLSLYKLLELRYRKNGHWNKKRLAELLGPYSKNFKGRGFRGEPAATLHGLRDKCAHIRTGSKGKREVLGVTHLNLPEVARLERILPVLRAACAVSINERVAGKFVLRTDVVSQGFQPVKGDV